jgi:hypothetical protein
VCAPDEWLTPWAGNDSSLSLFVVTKCEGYALGLVKTGKIFFQIFQFGKIIVDNVGIFRIVFQIILMVILGGIESFEASTFVTIGRE